MKTQLVHSFSSSSLSNLSRSQSQASFANNGANGAANGGGPVQTSQQGLYQKDTEEEGFVGCFKNWSKNTFRKKTLYKKLPIFRWIRHYTINKAISDLIAGFTVGKLYALYCWLRVLGIIRALKTCLQ